MKRVAICALALGILLLSPSRPAAAAVRPDLVVSSVRNPPASVQKGAGFALGLKVKNRGSREASGSKAAFYLSGDDRKDDLDLSLTKTKGVPRLGPGEAWKGKARPVAPVSAPLEPLTLLACADDRTQVHESNEGNNCRPAARPVEIVEPVSTYDLIDQAVADGDLDAETGLAYKVFRDYGDPRLPGRYRGNDTGVGEPSALEDAAAAWDTLSAPTQATLEPFFVPPIYEESWFGQPQNQAAAARREPARTAGPDPNPCTQSDAWDFVPTQNGKVRVWYQTRYGDSERIDSEAIAVAINTKIWPDLAGLMGREPLPDGGSTKQCRGGDDQLDIYRLNIGRSVAKPYPDTLCDQAPTYILLSRHDGFELAAHELMHAFQNSYDVVGCFNPEYRWLKEATAEWVQDFVYPGTQSEHHTANFLMGAPRTPLETFEQDGFHQYGAYLLPFFLSGEGRPNAAVVRRIWDNTQTMTSLAAVDAEMPGGFVDGWKDFVLHNWNRWLVDHYAQWDGLTQGAYPEGGQAVPVTLGGQAEATVDVRGAVKHLAASYRWYEFKDDVRQIEFQNGLLGNDDADVQAIVTLADGSQSVENWGGEDKVTFCRDKPSQDIKELVVIVSNHSMAGPPLPASAGDLVVKDACKLPEGFTGTFSGTHAVSDDSPFYEAPTESWNSTVTFERFQESCSEPTSPGFCAISGYQAYVLDDGSVSWSVAGGEPCSVTGSDSVVLSHEDDYTYLLLQRRPEEGHGRRYFGNITQADTMTATFDCGEDPAPGQWSFAAWWELPQHANREATGEDLLQGSYDPDPANSGDDYLFQWSFTPNG